MDRWHAAAGRRYAPALWLMVLSALPLIVLGASRDPFTSKDASGALRTALVQGVDEAVNRLGSPDGFLQNPQYTIPLPPALVKADRPLRLIGMSGDVEKLKTAMNHAAEMAVANARPLFKRAVLQMPIKDAKGLLRGGDTAATSYFRKAMGLELARNFKHIVARATVRANARQLYDEYAAKAAQVGFISSEDGSLNDYLTASAMAAVFEEIGTQETAIRKDPASQKSALIRKVFGAL
ncbi:MAG TPA: DUF4197 domain-containing protein [Steroidobacteraceae bacterium]|nr:DUF4197 domain-containing protein [Steroidobacteraceae bacterium]